MAKSTNPKGAGRKPALIQKSKTSLFVEPDIFKEIKIIAAIIGDTITDVVNEALKNYVKQWEQKNGDVPRKPD